MEEKLLRYFSGDISDEEKDEVLSWRNESIENAETYFNTKKIWLMSAPDNFNNKPGRIANILDKTESVFSLRSYSWIKYAAAIVIVIGAVLFLTFYGNDGSDVNVISLSDGTEVFLHKESEITSQNISDEVREVALKGKAYFNVRRDEKRPFYISTATAKIEVLGTSFVVDTYEEKTEVCVESGEVLLIKPAANNKRQISLNLKGGEVGIVNNRSQGIIKRNNNNQNYLAWKTKTLIFKNLKMSEVQEILHDVYGVEVEFEDTSFKRCLITATLKEKKVEDAIAIIAKTFGMTYEVSDDKAKVLIKGKGC